MKQQGGSMLAVLCACALLASAQLSQNLMLATAQKSLAHRRWHSQALAAAEAMVRSAQAGAWSVRSAPASGCQDGRCAWLGEAALARKTWANALSSAGSCAGISAHGSAPEDWPTLPGSTIWCWLESTSSPQGILWRITAWIQGMDPAQATVVQAVWFIPATGSGHWLSWREVMP